jgi:hypothetical protein
VIDILPSDGAEMAVVGVAVATGTNRQLDSGAIWAELEIGDITGWANTAFLLQSGVVEDVTASRYPTPSDRPTAETLVDLAQVVADAQRWQDVTIVDGPSVGDLGEVAVDVLGLRDDSVGGVRLRIFAEEGPDGFTVRTVEQTARCRRGVGEDGLCV